MKIGYLKEKRSDAYWSNSLSSYLGVVNCVGHFYAYSSIHICTDICEYRRISIVMNHMKGGPTCYCVDSDYYSPLTQHKASSETLKNYTARKWGSQGPGQGSAVSTTSHTLNWHLSLPSSISTILNAAVLYSLSKISWNWWREELERTHLQLTGLPNSSVQTIAPASTWTVRLVSGHSSRLFFFGGGLKVPGRIRMWGLNQNNTWSTHRV